MESLADGREVAAAGTRVRSAAWAWVQPGQGCGVDMRTKKGGGADRTPAAHPAPSFAAAAGTGVRTYSTDCVLKGRTDRSHAWAHGTPKKGTLPDGKRRKREVVRLKLPSLQLPWIRNLKIAFIWVWALSDL